MDHGSDHHPFSIIVVPADGDQVRLAPGQSVLFGRERPPERPGDPHVTVAHDGVSRRAGRIAAEGAFWKLSNLSRRQTYVVENPEGAGEHVKVAPGRLDAPIPFEFSRLVLPAADDLLRVVDVWAPRHDYHDELTPLSGQATSAAFPLDRSKRYFLVLTALCEPRLRGDALATTPTVDQVAQRLRPVWPAANRTTVQWNIDYLAVKLRLKAGPDEAACGGRMHGKKDAVAALAVRFDLVGEDDLALLEGDAP